MDRTIGTHYTILIVRNPQNSIANHLGFDPPRVWGFGHQDFSSEPMRVNMALNNQHMAC